MKRARITLDDITRPIDCVCGKCGGPATINTILFRLETAMHHHLDSPVTGNFIALIRTWREILNEAY